MVCAFCGDNLFFFWYFILGFGLMPFTNFFIGLLCAELGVTWGTFIIGVVCGLVALFYYGNLKNYRNKLRPLYKERGMNKAERPI